MAPGTAIGAAAPLVISKSGVTAAGEKTVSAITATMRSLAEKNGHPPELAAAMVDADIELREAKVNGKTTFLSLTKAAEAPPQAKVELGAWVTTKGKLLTLTAAEAKRLGIAAGLAANRKELIQVLGIRSDTMVDLKTADALREATENRDQYLAQLDAQIAAAEARAYALDPATYTYVRLRKHVAFRQVGEFEDEGVLWRQRSDGCTQAIDACLAACRRKLVLARNYPEMNINTQPVEAKVAQLLALRERVRSDYQKRGTEK
jgi:hypothetical protein